MNLCPQVWTAAHRSIPVQLLSAKVVLCKTSAKERQSQASQCNASLTLKHTACQWYFGPSTSGIATNPGVRTTQ